MPTPINYIFLFLNVQATIPGFVSKGLTIKEGENLLRKSVKLALEARNKFWKAVQEHPTYNYNYALVAASVGSCGAYLADGSEYRCVCVYFNFISNTTFACFIAEWPLG